MGEPLNNYNAVVEAVRAMLKQPFQLSPKRITISTVSTEKYTSKHFWGQNRTNSLCYFPFFSLLTHILISFACRLELFMR